jgi:hypothetical protein
MDLDVTALDLAQRGKLSIFSSSTLSRTLLASGRERLNSS